MFLLNRWSPALQVCPGVCPACLLDRTLAREAKFPGSRLPRLRGTQMIGDLTYSLGTPAWADRLAPAASRPHLSGTQTADFAVVGAGITGLCVAHELARLEPQKKVLVLDGTRVGLGSSGRNSGFIMDIPHYDSSLGPAGNELLIRLGRAGIRHLQELVTAAGCNCQWSADGCLRGAATDRGMRRLEEFARGMEQLKEDFSWLDRDAMEKLTGTRFYRAGIRCPGPVLVQPWRLVQGLADALGENVQIFEESEVLSVEFGRPPKLRLAGAEVSASAIFLAVNGYAPWLALLSRRIVPLVTFASMTHPIAAAELSACAASHPWGLIPEERIGTTVRRTEDDRVLIRNTVLYQGKGTLGRQSLERARRQHRASLAARFPALSDHPFSHTWAGVLGMTLNRASFFGPLHPGQSVFVAAGFNGVGLALGAIAGKLLADLALGCAAEELWAITRLRRAWPLPPPALLAPALRALLSWTTWRARGEI